MDKKIENLGKLHGKILLFGGAYSNFQALTALKAIAEQLQIPPTNCIATGDIVGYCAQPEETVQLLKKWNAKSILGNVEIQLIDDAEDCGCDFTEGSRCDGFSKLWYPFAKTKLTNNSLHYLKTLPHHITFQIGTRKATVVHGSFFNTSEFIFKSTDWSKKSLNFSETNADIIIAGHCGLPFYEQQKKWHWINPGVIGMPANDGSPNVWYAIIEDTENALKVSYKKLEYDFNLASKLMQTHGLPKEYAQTLVTGIWDNTEILPSKESALQGKRIPLID
ncbi:metallophosphoesterase family protein [Tenacibaculum maritimum]|uniref:metallophosphoesterase family protein n=1 Tax=Tenacibaculum maritimum TaxID=107401 RepID=UPI0012E56388|nr:metallophosphoesterase family protein [Tenacibaculum maritimum]CAA0244962.1 conserved hypothetical protein. Putative phosphatase [Tenacibaculum maritimum]